MTWFVVALVGGVFGFVAGVYLVTASLRDKARVLDAERLELENDRTELRESQRRHYDQVVQFVAMSTPKAATSPSRWMA